MCSELYSVRFIFCILFSLLLCSNFNANNNDKAKSAIKHVSGKVTSVSGEELSVVKITIKETNETFYADLDGNFKFQIKADREYSLSIECIGYVPLELKSTNLNRFSEISLQEL